ncbi:MAG TPA: type II toxin-antitoxin system PemK/MazF family toxin [Candidatus Saccharimonadia bacterium]
MGVTRGEVYLANFDPTVGNEVGKPRPCLVISPDEMNLKAGTFIAVPLSSKHKPYMSRVNCEFRGRPAQAQLDQIRPMSPLRIIAKLGQLDEPSLHRVLDRLQEMFAI